MTFEEARQVLSEDPPRMERAEDSMRYVEAGMVESGASPELIEAVRERLTGLRGLRSEAQGPEGSSSQGAEDSVTELRYLCVRLQRERGHVPLAVLRRYEEAGQHQM
jgi:hypothetical protein